ncbi:hypothetical protein DET57_1351, partial [Klebsiella oxytoca]
MKTTLLNTVLLTAMMSIDWPLESPDTSCHLLRDSLNTGFQTGCWSSDD